MKGISATNMIGYLMMINVDKLLIVFHKSIINKMVKCRNNDSLNALKGYDINDKCYCRFGDFVSLVTTIECFSHLVICAGSDILHLVHNFQL